MKRAVIVSLIVLELALVALVVWSSLRAKVPQPPLDLGGPAAAENTLAPGAAPVAVEGPASAEAAAPAREVARPDPAAIVSGDTRPSNSSVRGQVVFADSGEPVRGGRVTLHASIPHLTGFVPFENAAEAKAGSLRESPIGADGRFAFELPIGTKVQGLEVSADPRALEGPRTTANAASRFSRRSEMFELVLGPDPIERTIEVRHGLDLTGVVLDEVSGGPVWGARVSPHATRGEGRTVLSERDGTFVVAELNETKPVEVSHPDYFTQSFPVAAKDLAPGARTFEVRLRRGLAVSGLLVDARRRPLAGLIVRLRAGTDLCSARTNSEGRFRLSPAHPCESATIEVDAQTTAEGAISGLRHEVGPLHIDVDGLEVVVDAVGTLLVRAVRPDGTELEPQQFQVACENAPQASVSLDREHRARRIHAPLGAELELVAWTSAGEKGDSAAFLCARERLRLDCARGEPQELRLVLAERGRFELPPPPQGAKLLEVSTPVYLRGAVDVQLVDAASGRPLGGERRLSFSTAGASLSTAGLLDGWLRVGGRPGSYRIDVEAEGGARDSFEVAIPATGYAREERKLRLP